MAACELAQTTTYSIQGNLACSSTAVPVHRCALRMPGSKEMCCMLSTSLHAPTVQPSQQPAGWRPQARPLPALLPALVILNDLLHLLLLGIMGRNSFSWALPTVPRDPQPQLGPRTVPSTLLQPQ